MTFDWNTLYVSDPSAPKFINTDYPSATYSLGPTAYGRGDTKARIFGDINIGEQYLNIARQRAEQGHIINCNNYDFFEFPFTLSNGDQINFVRNYDSDRVDIYTFSSETKKKDLVLNFDPSVLQYESEISFIPEKNFNMPSTFTRGTPTIQKASSGLSFLRQSSDGCDFYGPYIYKPSVRGTTFIHTIRLNKTDDGSSCFQAYPLTEGKFVNNYCYIYYYYGDLLLNGNVSEEVSGFNFNNPITVACSQEIIDIKETGTAYGGSMITYDVTSRCHLYLNGSALKSDTVVKDSTYSPTVKDDTFSIKNSLRSYGNEIDFYQYVVHDRVLEPDVIADISAAHRSKWGF